MTTIIKIIVIIINIGRWLSMYNVSVITSPFCSPWISAGGGCTDAIWLLSELPSLPIDFSNGSTTAWGLSVGDLDITLFSGVPFTDFSFLLLSDLETLRTGDFPVELSLEFSLVTSTAGAVCDGVVDLLSGVDGLSLCSELDPTSLCKVKKTIVH